MKIKAFFLFGILAAFSILPSTAIFADDDPAGTVAEKVVQTVPKSELDNLKAEWEGVREQQIEMIREKEEQLDKLKEEIFAKMKILNAAAAPQIVASQPVAPETSKPALPVVQNESVVPSNKAELEAAKEAFRAERQKFFKEMNRQKESLRQLQTALDEKAKQLELDRGRLELKKKNTVS